MQLLILDVDHEANDLGRLVALGSGAAPARGGAGGGAALAHSGVGSGPLNPIRCSPTTLGQRGELVSLTL
jgi:hypothetical protein